MTVCLLVDSDLEARQFLCTQLTRYGICVDLVDSARAMWTQLAEGKIDIVLLDSQLTDGEGIELCRRLRLRSKVPVIMLGRHGDAIGPILGLEIGADDYVSKPCDPRELLARMKAIMRRATGSRSTPPAPTSTGPQVTPVLREWKIDWCNRMLISPEGMGQTLSNSEFRLFAAFTEHPDRILSRQALIELTRGDSSFSNRSVDLAVSRLRAKLRESVYDPCIIETVRGEGYRLLGEAIR